MSVIQITEENTDYVWINGQPCIVPEVRMECTACGEVDKAAFNDIEPRVQRFIDTHSTCEKESK